MCIVYCFSSRHYLWRVGRDLFADKQLLTSILVWYEYSLPCWRSWIWNFSCAMHAWYVALVACDCLRLVLYYYCRLRLSSLEKWCTWSCHGDVFPGPGLDENSQPVGPAVMPECLFLLIRNIQNQWYQKPTKRQIKSFLSNGLLFGVTTVASTPLI